MEQRLSKQEKKKLKYERVKAARRLQKKKRVESKRQERKALLDNMTTEERQAFVNAERSQKERLAAEADRASQAGVPIFFDLSFAELMNQAEQVSLVTQVCEAIGYQRKQESQVFQLVCCSVTETVQLLFEQMGSKRWGIQLRTEDIFQVAQEKGRTLVMLSPDAVDPLEELDLEHSVYVIGGLVDKTRKKMKTLEKAAGHHLKVFRLPIQEHVAPNLSLVLNLNTVFEALLCKANGASWEDALKSTVPKRFLNRANLP